MSRAVAVALMLFLAAAAPTTKPASPPRTLRLADAVPLEQFRGIDHEVDLRQHLPGAKQGEIYFGQADTIDGQGESSSTVPLIVAARGKQWVGLSLADDRLTNAEWQFVASGPAADEIWGVLDDTLTNRGQRILLVHSVDAGATWSVIAINKPFASGEYDSFAMSASGRGRVTIYVPGNAKHPARAGFYHFRTTDGGKTWSDPEHEADALTPAEEVSPDEDPPPLQEVPTQRAQAVTPDKVGATVNRPPSPLEGEGGGEGKSRGG
jgi:hypothetical protein